MLSTVSSTGKTLMLLAASGLMAASASAADLYWSGNATVLGGSGTWNTTSTFWNASGPQLSTEPTNVAWNNANLDTAVFLMNNNSPTATLGSAVTVGGISLTGTGTGLVTVSSSSTNALTINSGASLNVDTGQSLNLMGIGNGASILSTNFSKDGAGLLSFNAYTTTVASAGTITINNGTLRLSDYASNFSAKNVNLTNNSAILEASSNNGNSGLVGAQIAALTGSTGTVRTSNSNTVGYLRLTGNTDSTFGGTLTNGTTGGVLGFTKTGAGKVTLSNSANDATGPVGVFNGIWEASTAGAGSGKIALYGMGKGTSRTAGTYQNAGAGTLDAAATVAAFYSGTIKGYNLSLDDLNNRVQVLSGGILQYDSATDIVGSGQVLDGASQGAILAAGYAMDNAFLQRIKTGFHGTIALAADSANNLDFNSTSGLNSANARLGAVGAARSYTGVITPNGNTYLVGGGNNKLTLTNALTDGGGTRNLNVGAEALFGQMTSSFTDGINFIQLAGTAGVDTTNLAHPVLTADNTFTGTTTVGPYSVLELSGANGALSGTSGVAIRGGGTLYLNDQTGATKADRINDLASLTVDQGASVYFKGTGGNTETMNVLNLNSGQSYFSTSRNSGTGVTMLRFDSLSRSTGATMMNTIGANTQLSFVTGPTPGGDNSALGGWATANGGADWATYNGTTIGALGTYTTTGNTTWLPTSNVNLTASATVSAANTTVYSLRCTAVATLDLAGNTFTIDGGGVINNGAVGNNLTFQNGTLTAGNATGGGNYELFFLTNSTYRYITIAATANIADNAGSSVKVVTGLGYTTTADGGNDLRLTGNNTYTGGTYINNGLVTASLAGSLGTGPVYLNGVSNMGANNAQYLLAQLTLGGAAGSRTLANAINVNADGVLNQSAGTWTTTGAIALNNASTLRIGGNLTMNSTITGTGGLSCWNPSGNITIGGGSANTYSGDTLNLGGTIVLSKTAGNAIGGNLVIGGWSQTVSSTGTPVDHIVLLNGSDQIADTALVTMIGGGAVGNNRSLLRLNGNSDIIGGLSSTVGNGIVENAKASSTSTLTIQVAAGESYSFGGLLQNGTGAGSTLALYKFGDGVQTLTGVNTYTGSTFIGAGKLVVSSTGLINNTSGILVNAGGTLDYQNVTTALTKAINNLGGAVILGSGALGGTGATVRAGAGTGLAGYQSTAAGDLNTQFLILDGSAGDSGSGGRDLTVGWRTPTGAETALVSDVLSFTGTGDDLYALQLSYNPSAGGALFLAYFDGSSFVNAGTTFVGDRPYNSTADFTLGNWGVDTTNHVAWAVVNHNSEWAVTLVPEPGTMALLAFGSLAVLNLRRKKQKHG